MSKIILLLRVELTLSPSQFHTACRVSFAGLHQRRLPQASETQVNNADLEGISRCSRVVILETPDSEYCYLLTAIGMLLLTAGFKICFRVRAEDRAETSRILPDCRNSC